MYTSGAGIGMGHMIMIRNGGGIKIKVVRNPVGPNGSSDGRVIRGGSWANPAQNCRAANRDLQQPRQPLTTL